MSSSGKTLCKKIFKELNRNYQLYILVIPTIIYFVIFHYYPIYGVQIAFKEFIPIKGILGSPWLGLEQFKRFFNSYQFWPVVRNTLSLSIYQLFFGFPIPIVFALLLNQLNSIKFRRLIQTVTYAPHFLSIPAVVGMIVIFLAPNGLISHLLKAVTGQDYGVIMGNPKYFPAIYVLSGIWQNTGWEAIIYIASLTSISPELYEAAVIDGANKFNKIWYIDLPGIMPTAITLLILNCGRIMNIGFEKVFLMQNSMNIDASEVISTYVYKIGLLGAQYSYAAAIGLFNSIVNFLLLIIVNTVAKKFSETSLW